MDAQAYNRLSVILEAFMVYNKVVFYVYVCIYLYQPIYVNTKWCRKDEMVSLDIGKLENS